MSFQALLLTVGICCIWPCALFALGFWFGRNRIRIQSPIKRIAPPFNGEDIKRDSIGYGDKHRRQ